MRADEFIPPKEQINILIRVASQARVDLQNQLNATDQRGSVGDSPLDFFKKILDMTFDEIYQWVIFHGSQDGSGSDPSAPSSFQPSKSVSPTPTLKNVPVATTKAPKASRAPKASKPSKVKRSKKKIKPKRVEPLPASKPIPQPVKRVTPPNPNPGQPLARIKPYGPIGVMK